MSKITELRRKATEATRSRKWDDAVKLYERICDLDGSNPGYRNELGDVFAKMGDIPQALSCFEKAAALYDAVGLANNAIAVHKKILRYDPRHMDSHWGLGETRRRQGLPTDAANHYLHFLDCAEEVAEENRGRFLDRCSLLLDHVPGDLDILGKLDALYEAWKMPDERARILLCKALLARESGEEDLVDRYLERAHELGGEALTHFPEYAELLPDAERPAADLGEEGEESEDLDLELGFDLPTGTGAHEPLAEGSPSEADPSEEEAIPVHEIPAADEIEISLDEPSEPVTEAAPEASGAHETGPASGVSQGVNLLEEILSEGGLDLEEADKQQVATIQEDLAGQMGGSVAEDDHQGHYDLGLVYLDMGMLEQALPSFEKAAQGEDFRLKALEMQGNCLHRLGRSEEALEVYREGLSVGGHAPSQYLGLLYEMANCLEAMDRVEESLRFFERAAAVDPSFLDVQQRLDTLRAKT